MTDLDKQLWKALNDRDTDLVKQLVESGADINSRNKDGTTPLHHTISTFMGHDIIDFLLIKGADINAQDNSLNTPLHNAARFYSYNLVWKLIEKGADMNIENKLKQTPFGLVLYKDLSGVLYRSDLNPTNQPLFFGTPERAAIEDKAIEEKAKFIDKLIDYGAETKKITYNESFVDIAMKSFYTNPDIYLSLLSSGASISDSQIFRDYARSILSILETNGLSEEKKYTGIKTFRKAVDESRSLDDQIKKNAIKHIDDALKELKEGALHSLTTKIRAGFDNEKVEDRYRQIARDMSPDYPEVNLLKDYGEGRITSRDFAMQEKIKKSFDDLSASIDASNSMSFVGRIKNVVGTKQQNKTHSQGGRGRSS